MRFIRLVLAPRTFTASADLRFQRTAEKRSGFSGDASKQNRIPGSVRLEDLSQGDAERHCSRAENHRTSSSCHAALVQHIQMTLFYLPCNMKSAACSATPYNVA